MPANGVSLVVVFIVPISMAPGLYNRILRNAIVKLLPAPPSPPSLSSHAHVTVKLRL